MKSVPVIGAIKSALSVAALSLALAGCVASGGLKIPNPFSSCLR